MRAAFVIAHQSARGVGPTTTFVLTGIPSTHPRSLSVRRFPFLLVDRIVKYEQGQMAVGLKNVTVNDNFFPGHFPQRPIMPGVLMVEALAQVGGIAMMDPDDPKENFFFGGIDGCKFRKPVVPGDTLVSAPPAEASPPDVCDPFRARSLTPTPQPLADAQGRVEEDEQALRRGQDGGQGLRGQGSRMRGGAHALHGKLSRAMRVSRRQHPMAE